MDSKAAQAQALFADQVDGQLTQGSAAQIRALGNAPMSLPGSQTRPAANAASSVAQYTPSAQEAATGAYSAPKQQTAAQPSQQPANPPAQQPLTPGDLTGKKGKKTARKTAAKTQTVPTLVTAPVEPDQQPAAAPETPAAPASGTTSTGLSDEELEQRSLPPLRGPWVRVQREPRPVGPREEAEMQLRSL